jgi:lysophospholipase L1-like esterase
LCDNRGCVWSGRVRSKRPDCPRPLQRRNRWNGADGSPSAVDRLNRDVIGVSGVTHVVWMEGINDLGGLKATPAPIIAGYKTVVASLHQHGIKVVGATLTSSFVPGGVVPPNSPLAVAGPAFAASYGSAQTNAFRKQLKTFILTSGIYDATADFATATTDPSTGATFAAFVPSSEGSAGDFLHLNRHGYQVMEDVAFTAVSNLQSSHLELKLVSL